jgi:hypothetical protein
MGSGSVVMPEKALRHELEKAQLQIAKEIAEKSQAQTETKYWKEKYEREIGN